MSIRPFTVLMILACASLTWAADPAPLLVGVARIDITPDGPIRLSGYLARSSESQGVAQPIGAKAVAIGADDQGAVVLVTVDNVGVPEAITAELATRLARAGLARERLAVGSSHTHSAPCLTGAIPNIFGKPIPPDEQARIDRYTRDLVDKLEKVCLDALADRKPARLSWTRGEVGFAANRRTKGGPVDHSLPVLKVSALDGSVRAVILNYACHCTTINAAENQVSGDWAGFAQAEIEARHPGCVALTLIGCGADANPAGRINPRAAADHGREIASEVDRLLGGAWVELSAPTSVGFERLSLPFDTLPTRSELEQLVKNGGPIGYNASTQLKKLDRGDSLATSLPYSTQAWRFGEQLVMVFLPGEVVVDYALRLRLEIDPSRLWVNAYANDVPCYVPSERILREGGYEGGGAMVYYGHPARLKPGVEQRIVDSVHRVVGPGFAPKVAAEESPPLSPAESIDAFRTRPGFKVELVAAEPLVESPVAIDFGADGRLWVCEMRDYPSGIDGQGKPGGVIKVLEDRDRDGQYETASTFLEGIPFPTGVMEWRKGVLICAAPDIIYAEDTDGDGKADIRRVLFQGFATENFQARVNGLALGLDNWVYGANGLIGGKIQGTVAGRTVDIGGRDFRMKPETGEFEPASGLTQQGRVRDDWGNQFGGNNSVLIQHYPLPDHAARRNPHYAPPAPAVALAHDPDSSLLSPASRTVARFNNPESANHVTSACSPLIYRDSLLGPGFAGNAFVCEPVHNLIRRLVVEPDGVTFAGHRASDERASEFLASVDPWCRPVQVRTGPDGALWVVDFYRSVIEHPRWISPELLATLDVRAGADRGRIYRVVPIGTPARPVERLAGLATPALAASLNTPNGTVRDLAHRLLVERADRAGAVPTLIHLAASSAYPECRVQALGVLDGLAELRPSLLARALGDPHPGVRREAVRLAGPWLTRDESLGPLVLALADDPEINVRFQVALTLGDWPDPRSGEALGRLAIRDAGDPWVLAAAMTSAVPHAGAMLDQAFASAGPTGPPAQLIEPLIATIGGSGAAPAIARALATIAGGDEAKLEPWRLATLAGMLDASPRGDLAGDPAVLRSVAAARSLGSDPTASPVSLVAALRLLGRDRDHLDPDRELIAGRLDPTEPSEVQFAAIQALARLGDPPSAAAILARWSKLGPSVRSAALDALLTREVSIAALLTALEAGGVESAQIDPTRRARLLQRGPEEFRRRASRLFGDSADRPRQVVLDAYASATTLQGNPERGRRVFEQVCATCHKVGGIGHEVGPDLAALTDRSPAALLLAILDPNREVDARYAGYSASLKDGRVLSGLISAETASALTLKGPDGRSDSILRTDLDELTTSGRSLMPEGLETGLKPPDLADLIAYLGPTVSPPREVEGNQPREVIPRDDGSILLEASTAEIRGPNLTFETAFANLGYWQSDQDHAVWNFRVDRPTQYTMAMEWACDDSTAGNAYQIQVDNRRIRGIIGGTGSWATYRSIFVGEVTLEPGVHRLEMRPSVPVRHALADVRGLLLTPRGVVPAPDRKP